MRKALFDPNTNRRINKFERARLEQRGVDLTPYDSERSGCGTCPKKNISNIMRGIFVYSEEDLYDDDDSTPYVCEHCRAIGFDSKYKPEECDVCTECEDCSDYTNGECDGCGYSTLYNGGMTYGEASGEGQQDLILSEDVSYIKQINEFDDRPHKPDGGFSIMNYD